jgi:hypothetical protein
MTAWQKLIAGSTLPGGTAWQHLNAQGGGGGVGDVYIYGELSVQIDSGDYVIKTAPDCRVQLDGELTVRLDDEAF